MALPILTIKITTPSSQHLYRLSKSTGPSYDAIFSLRYLHVPSPRRAGRSRTAVSPPRRPCLTTSASRPLPISHYLVSFASLLQLASPVTSAHQQATFAVLSRVSPGTPSSTQAWSLGTPSSTRAHSESSPLLLSLVALHPPGHGSPLSVRVSVGTPSPWTFPHFSSPLLHEAADRRQALRPSALVTPGTTSFPPTCPRLFSPPSHDGVSHHHLLRDFAPSGSVPWGFFPGVSSSAGRAPASALGLEWSQALAAAYCCAQRDPGPLAAGEPTPSSDREPLRGTGSASSRARCSDPLGPSSSAGTAPASAPALLRYPWNRYPRPRASSRPSGLARAPSGPDPPYRPD